MPTRPPSLRTLRDQVGQTRGGRGKWIKTPQSRLSIGEGANRQVDMTEFVARVLACGAKPEEAFGSLLEHF